ncbi:tRNA (adenine(58)-N(1))-methyltransferasenon-catalytic subunit TRM6 [Striga asiatica]|uniref:tRNA (Adenine(58)-N(1))-methyltransferasenon-catalytic subunit TRM6 n=1 Tax=Striga asiatica TaxID=4170 RepID=A0A5A7QPL0_STRAF|nr:tRNA (adenine(58)-N(1))-methyltransferasenon-catalytic subunit TRM6 [Striga asiatica]
MPVFLQIRTTVNLCLDLGATLADDNGAGLRGLVAEDLDPKPLPLRVTAVLSATSSFLVRRQNRQPRLDRERNGDVLADVNRTEVASEEGRRGAGTNGKAFERAH